MSPILDQSWLSPLAEVRAAGRKGRGIFARADIAAGTTVAVFGGNAVARAEFEAFPEEIQHHAIQVDDDIFLASVPPYAPADRVNHSCEPNCGIEGSILLVTLRAVAADEELCFDYAMSDTDPYDEFTCECGTARCRGTITGKDWRIRELQERYAGYFSSYIARKLADFDD